MARRIDVLEMDNANLKRELASRATVSAVGFSLRARTGDLCMHGSANCQALACRASR
jgi:hypothetical protein